jgi:hypothetical protein
MPALRERDFDQLATQVVDQFLAGKAKLAEAAAEQATANGLNPDQIQRLVEAANTMTFLRLMDQRKAEGAGNLMHEFDPIDSRQVIRIVIDNAGVHVEPADHEAPQLEHQSDELPDEMSAVRLNPGEGEPGHKDSPQVEECEEECHDRLDPPGLNTKKRAPSKKDEAPVAEKKPPFKPPSKEGELLRLRKLSDILEDQVKQAAWAFEDTFDRLSDRFKRAYSPSFEDFEKDAMAECSDAVGVGVMNLLRSSRGLSPIVAPPLEKTAELCDRYVSEDTLELDLFEQLVKIAREAAQIEQGIAWMKDLCSR